MSKLRQGKRFVMDGTPSEDFFLAVQSLCGGPVREFCEAVADIAAANGDDSAYLNELVDRLGKTRPTIQSYISALQARGLAEMFQEQNIGPDGKARRPVNSYRVLPHNALNVKPEAIEVGERTPLPTHQDHPTQDLFFDDEGRGILPAKAERKALFSLFSALPWRSTKKEYRTRVYIGPSYADVTVTASRGVPATIDNLRVLIVLMTLVRDYIKNASDGQDKTEFVVGLGDLCRAIALPVSTGNKRYIYQVLLRWSRTSFELESWYTKQGQMTYFTHEKITRFIADLEVVGWAGATGKTPEYAKVVMNPYIQKALADDKGVLTIHEEIVKDSSLPAFDQALYFWARRAVQQASTDRHFTEKHWMREMRGDIPKGEFNRYYRDFIRRRDPQGSGRVEFGGYIFHYAVGQGIAVRRSETDPILNPRQSLAGPTAKGLPRADDEE